MVIAGGARCKVFVRLFREDGQEGLIRLRPALRRNQTKRCAGGFRPKFPERDYASLSRDLVVRDEETGNFGTKTSKRRRRFGKCGTKTSWTSPCRAGVSSGPRVRARRIASRRRWRGRSGSGGSGWFDEADWSAFGLVVLRTATAVHLRHPVAEAWIDAAGEGMTVGRAAPRPAASRSDGRYRGSA